MNNFKLGIFKTSITNTAHPEANEVDMLSTMGHLQADNLMEYCIVTSPLLSIFSTLAVCCPKWKSR